MKKPMLAIAVTMLLALGACGDGADQPAPADQPVPADQPPAAAPTPGAGVELPEGVTQDMVAQGQLIFNQQICFTCHGQNAVGAVLGPALNDQEWINIDGSYESIMQVVRNGMMTPVQYQTPMPPMGGIQLTDEQIRQVSAYVYAVSRGG